MEASGGHAIAVVASTLALLGGSFVSFVIWLVDRKSVVKIVAIPLFVVASLSFGCLLLSVVLDFAVYGALAFILLVIASVGIFLSFSAAAWMVLGLMPWQKEPEKAPPKLWIPPHAAFGKGQADCRKENRGRK